MPENTLKFAVGVMLTTFGIFWSAEGAGAHWPGDDASLPGVLALRRARLARRCSSPAAPARGGGRVRMRRLRAFGHFWWDFVVGDDWRAAAGVVARDRRSRPPSPPRDINAWWLMPVAVAAVLWLSLAARSWRVSHR